jgi:hypothetical protein
VLGFWIRALFAATSLAPMFLTFALVYALKRPAISGSLLLLAVALVVACKLIIKRAHKDIPQEEIYASSVKIADQSTLTFIVAYLFPLVFAKPSDPGITGLGVLALVFVLLLVAVYRSNGYSFNPVLGLVFGYHFYEIVTTKDFTYLVVSKREIVNTREPIEGRPLSLYMYLDAEG